MKTIYTTQEFDAWFSKLRDKEAKRRIQLRIDRAETGNLGDCSPVGGGVSEMRIHYGPGYRVYFLQKGIEIVVLLAGGDKSAQSKDIKKAIHIAQQIEEAL
jgi:putative addiction module killer protein